jgi:hypothetical protein
MRPLARGVFDGNVPQRPRGRGHEGLGLRLASASADARGAPPHVPPKTPLAGRAPSSTLVTVGPPPASFWGIGTGTQAPQAVLGATPGSVSQGSVSHRRRVTEDGTHTRKQKQTGYVSMPAPRQLDRRPITTATSGIRRRSNAVHFRAETAGRYKTVKSPVLSVRSNRQSPVPHLASPSPASLRSATSPHCAGCAGRGDWPLRGRSGLRCLLGPTLSLRPSKHRLRGLRSGPAFLNWRLTHGQSEPMQARRAGRPGSTPRRRCRAPRASALACQRGIPSVPWPRLRGRWHAAAERVVPRRKPGISRAPRSRMPARTPAASARWCPSARSSTGGGIPRGRSRRRGRRARLARAACPRKPRRRGWVT